MNPLQRVVGVLTLCAVGCVAHSTLAAAEEEAVTAGRQVKRHASLRRDGQRDFDFNIGTWKTHVSRLLHPLTGSKDWVEYRGLSIVLPVWNGRGNLLELRLKARRARSRASDCACTIRSPGSGASTGLTAATAS